MKPRKVVNFTPLLRQTLMFWRFHTQTHSHTPGFVCREVVSRGIAVQRGQHYRFVIWSCKYCYNMEPERATQVHMFTTLKRHVYMSPYTHAPFNSILTQSKRAISASWTCTQSYSSIRLKIVKEMWRVLSFSEAARLLVDSLFGTLTLHQTVSMYPRRLGV